MSKLFSYVKRFKDDGTEETYVRVSPGLILAGLIFLVVVVALIWP